LFGLLLAFLIAGVFGLAFLGAHLPPMH